MTRLSSNLQCFCRRCLFSRLALLGLLLLYLLRQLLFKIVLNSFKRNFYIFIHIANKIENPVDFLALDVLHEAEMNRHLLLFDEMLEIRLVHSHKGILRLEVVLPHTD